MLNWISRTATRTARRSAPKHGLRSHRRLRAEHLESRELLAGDLFQAGAMLTTASNIGHGFSPAAIAGPLTAGSLSRETAPAVPGSPASGVSQAQVANVQKLITDLQAIRANSQVTPQMVEQLIKDTAGLLKGTQRPSQQSVARLVADWKSAAADRKISSRELVVLQKDLARVLTEANIPKSEVTAVVNDWKAIVRARGVTPEQMQTILTDVRAIAAEAAANRLSPTQAANIQKLIADLQAIRANSQVTPEMVEQFLRDTAVLLQGTQKPSQQSVETLATDLKSATADGTISPLEMATLQRDLAQVLTEANIPESEVKAVVDDWKAIVTASGVTPEQVKTILADLQAIVLEAAANHSK